MNQRGGCCIARYAGGAYDNRSSMVDRIMLKYRPIAPKPSNSFSGGGSSKPENSEPSPRSTGRGKRKQHAAKDCSANKRCARTKTYQNAVVSDCEKSMKTLSFLPEMPDVKKLVSKDGFNSSPVWLSFGDGGSHVSQGMGHVSFGRRRATVESWVKVERVMETWVYGSYGTDEERVRSLDVDTCPGFVSDGVNRVRWTNGAYKRMLVGEGAEVVTSFVVEEGVVLPVGCTGFTCRVRVVTCGKEKNSKTVPCDVWRMECGGFAWRLDTAAALSLCI